MGVYRHGPRHDRRKIFTKQARNLKKNQARIDENRAILKKHAPKAAS